jgi:SAM-dependent methyltransferase
VLHHIPDTAQALADCVRLLKPGAPFLLYLYYRFDNRPLWFRALWQASNLLRRGVSRLPAGAKNLATDAIALSVYWPLARTAWLLQKAGLPVSWLPLSFYRNSSVVTLRTDSRDRFGTPLEQRFTRAEMETMMKNAGLEDIRFSPQEPYWVAVGRKAAA